MAVLIGSYFSCFVWYSDSLLIGYCFGPDGALYLGPQGLTHGQGGVIWIKNDEVLVLVIDFYYF